MSDTPLSFDDWWNSDPKDEAGNEYGLDEFYLLREGWRACIEHRAKPVERENADLRARLGAAEMDAVRYRWLRVHNDSMALDPPLTVARVCGWGLDAWSGDNLDAAIDAAITKEGP